MKKEKYKIPNLDINKKYPGYVNKWIFRFAILIMLCIFGYVLYLEDFQFSNSNHAYLECTADNQCINPFYYCKQNENNTFWITEIKNCDDILKLDVPDYFYNDQYIQPGEYIGDKPKYGWVSYAYVLVIFLAFVVNHVLYMYKKRSGKIGN